MPVTCAAIICVRNEEKHIRRAITDFISQNIDVVVIDNGSTDSTVNICSEFLNKGLLFIKDMPWEGAFNLSQQLQIKNEIMNSLHHDWVIHADADEWIHSNVEGESLLDGITRIEKNGFDVINLEEFVFLPAQDKKHNLNNIKEEFLDYYYFSPSKHRLMRIWKRSLGYSNFESGGHKLNDKNCNIFPESFILRHYIVLSHDYAAKKYLPRVFAECDLEKSWHGNRLNLTLEKLKLPPSEKLKQLNRWDCFNFDFSDPKKEHYWEWTEKS